MKDTGLLEPCAMKVARTVLRGGAWRHDAPTRWVLWSAGGFGDAALLPGG